MGNELKILNLFLGSESRRSWPSPFFDIENRFKEWLDKLEGIKKGLGFDIEFENELVSDMGKIDKVERWMGRDVDAIFVYILTSESSRFTYWASRMIADFGYDHIHEYGGYGLPTFFIIDLFGGDISGLPLVSYLKGKPALIISSSKIDEIERALRYAHIIKEMRNSKILLITERPSNPVKSPSDSYLNLVKSKFGVSVEYVSYSEVMNRYDSVDPSTVERITDDVIKGAKEVREPGREDVIKAVRMYLALKRLVSDHEANAIAIDCLGWLEYGKVKMPALPCLALSLLNSEGVVSACEADLHSALTMLLFRYLNGKTSLISDPVIDTGTNTVIHCHCTAPISVKVNGERSPYILRSHADSGTSVSVQVLMKEGEPVTVAKFVKGLEEMLVSRGKIIENVDIDRGCRTKIRVTVKDAEKYLEGYSGGLHRVLVIGDYVRDLERIGRLLGFRAMIEGE